MNRDEIRPLLMAKVEAMKEEERAAEKAVREAQAGWSPVSLALEQWRAARLKRAEAELQLWLSDRQWEREREGEEAEALLSQGTLANLPNASTSFKV